MINPNPITFQSHAHAVPALGSLSGLLLLKRFENIVETYGQLPCFRFL